MLGAVANPPRVFPTSIAGVGHVPRPNENDPRVQHRLLWPGTADPLPEFFSFFVWI